MPRMLETRDDIEKRMAAELAAARQEVEQLKKDLTQEQSRIKLPPVGWPFRR
jgi:hypothetical protein